MECNCHVPEGNLKRCPIHGPQGSRTIAASREAADDARDAERAFVDDLLNRVGQVIEDLDHEIGNMRSVGQEDDARAIEDAMRPLRAIHSGVEPDG